MALFAVSRYMGEEENDLQDVIKPKTSAAAILEKIKSDVEARRLKRKKESGKRSASKSSDEVKKKRKIAKSDDTSPSLNEAEQITNSLNLGTLVPSNKRTTETSKVRNKRKSKSDTDHSVIYSDIKENKNDKRKSDINSSDVSLISDEQTELDKLLDVGDSSVGGKDSSSRVAKQSKQKGRKSDERDDVNDKYSESESEDTKSESSENSSDVEMSRVSEDMDISSEHLEGPHEVGGFTVLGKFKPKTAAKVKRILPNWLADPNTISSDLKLNTTPVTGIKELDQDLVTKLQENGITHFFPVQMQVIPVMLDVLRHGFITGKAGYRPSDLCISAPTGSGKTLAFVLPIVQALKNRVECKIRALAVLPVRDLAMQVFKVFQTYCNGTNLKVELLVGQRPFPAEQRSIVKKRLRGYHSLADIVIATPGRLVDHINKTDGFDLSGLRFLVIDEADKMIDQIKQDWLIQVENAVFNRETRPSPGSLTVHSTNKFEMPLQKLLFSATLTQNPEKLQQLNLFQPKLFTSVEHRDTPTHSVPDTKGGENESNQITDEKPESNEKTGEFIGKFTTPAGLTEFYVECTAAEKPLMMLHFLHNLKFSHVLCFTNSIEAAHRLYHLLKLVGGITVQELSSRLRGTKHKKILQKFSKGKIDVLICSDALARGIDVDDVKYVISYDPPAFIKTYIHRVGRTARAGKVGTAVTLLQKKEFFHFKKMTREVGKTGIKELKVNRTTLEPIVPCFETALGELAKVLKDESVKKK